MRRAEQVNRLQELSDLRLHHVQAEMSQLLTRQRDLQAALNDLTGRRKQRADGLCGPSDAAFVAGADMAWHLWVEQRRRQINTELAKVLAEQDQCRLRLSRALGQTQAINGLAQKLQRRR